MVVLKSISLSIRFGWETEPTGPGNRLGLCIMYLVCYSCRHGYGVHQESIDFVKEQTCSNGHVHDIRCRCGRKIYVVQRVDSRRWKSIDRKVLWKYPDERTPGK